MSKAEQASLYHRYRNWIRARRHLKKGRFPPPDPVHVPPEVEVLEMLGEGKRTCTYRARFEGRAAVLKVYRTSVLNRYRWRFGINLAQFEYDRNRAFWDNPALQRYTVEPLRVFGVNDNYSPAFLQAWAEGISLTDFAAERGAIPEYILAAGYQLVRTAHAEELFDLDLNVGNIKLRQLNDALTPLVYDFNLLPQNLYPPNPFRALSFKLGWRYAGYRDCAALESWANHSLFQTAMHLG